MNNNTIVESLGHLFYFVKPSKTSFETVAEVPHYIGSVSLFHHFYLANCFELECL